MRLKNLFFLSAFAVFAIGKTFKPNKSFFMDQRLTIITLGVTNLESSTAFYEQKFGWKRSKASNKDISFFHLNNFELALFNKVELAKDVGVDAKGSGFRAFSLAYNTKSEKEVDLLFSEFVNKGVTIVKKPAKASWGGYSGYIADPDGNLWEVAYNPYLPLDDKGNTMEE
jgi:uncharacterized protein